MFHRTFHLPGHARGILLSGGTCCRNVIKLDVESSEETFSPSFFLLPPLSPSFSSSFHHLSSFVVLFIRRPIVAARFSPPCCLLVRRLVRARVFDESVKLPLPERERREKVEEHAKRPQPRSGHIKIWTIISKLSRRVSKRARGASNLFCPSVCRLLPGRICGVPHRRLFITDDSALRVSSVFSSRNSRHFSHQGSPYVSK